MNKKGTIFERLERKTQAECKYILRGDVCPFGSRCKFAHNIDRKSYDYGHNESLPGSFKIIATQEYTPRDKPYRQPYGRSKSKNDVDPDKEVVVVLDDEYPQAFSREGSENPESRSKPRLIRLKKDQQPSLELDARDISPKVEFEDDKESSSRLAIIRTPTNPGSPKLKPSMVTAEGETHPSPRLSKLLKPKTGISPSDQVLTERREITIVPALEPGEIVEQGPKDSRKRKMVKGEKFTYSDWQIVTSKTGAKYYYNSVTHESVWKVPTELKGTELDLSIKKAKTPPRELEAGELVEETGVQPRKKVRLVKTEPVHLEEEPPFEERPIITHPRDLYSRELPPRDMHPREMYPTDSPPYVRKERALDGEYEHPDDRDYYLRAPHRERYPLQDEYGVSRYEMGERDRLAERENGRYSRGGSLGPGDRYRPHDPEFVDSDFPDLDRRPGYGRPGRYDEKRDGDRLPPRYYDREPPGRPREYDRFDEPRRGYGDWRDDDLYHRDRYRDRYDLERPGMADRDHRDRLERERERWEGERGRHGDRPLRARARSRSVSPPKRSSENQVTEPVGQARPADKGELKEGRLERGDLETQKEDTTNKQDQKDRHPESDMERGGRGEDEKASKPRKSPTNDDTLVPEAEAVTPEDLMPIEPIDEEEAERVFDLHRVSQEEKTAKTLRAVVSHTSESLLGRELSANISDALNQYVRAKGPAPLVPHTVDRELEKVFVDALVAKFPSRDRRGVSPPRSITSDSDWEQRCLLALKSPEELESISYGLQDSKPSEGKPAPISQELMHSCLKLLDASQKDTNKGTFAIRVIPSKLGFLKVRQMKGISHHQVGSS